MMIVNEGNVADNMYFISKGSCDVYMNGNWIKRLYEGTQESNQKGTILEKLVSLMGEAAQRRFVRLDRRDC